MNMILFTKTSELESEITHKLIPDGINIYQGSSLQDLEVFNEFEYNFCLIDDSDYPARDIVRALHIRRKTNPDKKTRFILLTSLPESENIKMSTLLGFDFIIPLSLRIDKVADLIQIFVSKNSNRNEKRQYIRFKLNETENGFVKLNGLAKITDISMNSISVSLDKMPENDLVENAIYGKTQILLDNKSIFSDIKLLRTDLKLIYKNSEKAIFQFERLDDHTKNFLAEYIYFKTQEMYFPKKI